MKSIYSNTLGFLIVSVMLFGISACSKDEGRSGLEDVSGDSYISMKINGQVWKSDLAGVTTFYNAAEEENEDFFTVGISGFKCEDCDAEAVLGEEVESLGIIIVILMNKYNDPKGAYVAGSLDDDNLDANGESMVVFHKSTVEKEQLWDYYISDDVAGKVKSKGSVKINGFKTGKFGFYGETVEGYTHLSGTFEYDLFKAMGEDESPEKLVITEGKFHLDALSFYKGFL